MPAKPPILILMTDQQRADGVGCAGTEVLETPNMDRLAAEGVRFGNACTTSPVCMPARLSFVNGLYCHNHGMWRNRGEPPVDDETLFHHLQRAGYHVAYVGKSHFYPHGHGGHLRDREDWMRRRGIDTVREATGPLATAKTGSWLTDEWERDGIWGVYRDDYAKRAEVGGWDARWPSPHTEEQHLDAMIGREAVRAIDAYDDGKPLCLFVGFGGPHSPWDPPGKYAEMYDSASCPPAIPPNENDPPALSPGQQKLAMAKRRCPLDERAVAEIRALYYGKISLLDHWFGEVLGAFERKNLLDDALVVHWSDHGEMLGDHGLLNKGVFYESALRVPLTVRWPGGGTAGKVCESPVEIIDVFPTLLEAIGAEPSKRCLGRSLVPCLRGPGASVRDAVFSEILDCTMVRTRRHKYALDSSGTGFLLFDLERDPDERENLIGRPGTEELEREMRGRIFDWLLATQIRMA
ncbi:MAG: sulfatase-like hydrolase/transferase [Planctomycetota bacterium]|jgi:choline-sulfatase